MFVPLNKKKELKMKTNNCLPQLLVALLCLIAGSISPSNTLEDAVAKTANNLQNTTLYLVGVVAVALIFMLVSTNKKNTIQKITN